MNADPSALDALVAGSTALVTPALAVVLLAVGAAAVALGARADRREHVVVAIVLGLVFALATARRGVAAPGVFSLWVGWVAFAALVVAWRDHGSPWRAPFAGLLVGVTAVLWRLDAYGTVLAELRGGWQSAPSFGSMLPYHVGTGLGLAATYLILAEIARRLPARTGPIVWGGIGLVTLATIALGAWPDLVRVLMMRWPHVPFG